MAVRTQSSFILPDKFENLCFSDCESIESMSTDASSTPSTPRSPLVGPITIQVITKDDYDEVLKFLQVFFFRDEPLNNYIQLLTDEQPRCYELEDYCMKELDSGLNLKAVADGRIVGVCLNGILERGYIDHLEPIQCNSEKFSKVLTLLDYVAVKSNVFQHFPDCDKAMTVKIVSVNSECRGRGIARELMSKTRDLAKENGCGFVTVDCSSHFTAMALKNLGFNCVYSLKYADYIMDGKVVFKPEAPHVAVTVYTQRV